MRTTVLLAAIVAIACSACGHQKVALRPVGAGANYFPISQRQAAPTLTGTSVDGAPISSAADRGRVLVVNIWGSWCPPCRAEADGLAAAAKAAGPQGARFLGIDVEDTTSKAKAYEQTHGITYPSLFDASGALRTKFAYPALATPTTYVIDPKGRIAAVVYGKVTEAALDTLIGKAQAA
jgi:peroxiredoxin